MSFYGTVYYQLIDTFNKVAMRNSSIEEKSFPSNIVTSDQQINAIGRDAKLSIEGGNRWINFTKDTTNNCFKVWHAIPDTTSSSWIEGYQKVDQDSIPANTDITELDPGDYFKTFSVKYDAAGHIVPDALETKYYKMPKSEVEEELEALQALVGNKTDEENNEEATGLCKEVEDNTKNIATNTLDLQLLKDVYGGTDGETAYALFASPWVTGGGEDNKFPNFPQYFGHIDTLIENCNNAASSFVDQRVLQSTDYNPISPCDTASEGISILATMIQKLKTYCDTQDEEAEATAAAAASAVTLLKNDHDITKANLSTLTAKHDAYESSNNVEVAGIKTELARIEAECESAEGALKGRLDTTDGNLSTFKTSYDTYVEQNDINIGQINANITALQNEDNTIKTALGENKGADSTGLYKIIADGDSAISLALNQSITNQQGINAGYDGRISANTVNINALSENLGSKTVTDGVYTEVSGVYVDIKSLDDKIAGVNTTLNGLNPVVTNLAASVGTPATVNGGDSEPVAATGLYKDIYDINDEISSLKTIIGSESDSSGIYQLFKAMQEKIDALETRIEALENPEGAGEENLETE